MHSNANNGVQRLLAAMSANVLGTLLAAIAGVGATAVMARNLPVAEFGKVLLLLTAVNGFAIFEGLRPVVIHRVAMTPESPRSLFQAAMKINVGMALVTLACLNLILWAGISNSLPPFSGVLLGAIAVAFFIVMQIWTFLDAEQETVFTGISRALCWTLLYTSFGIFALTNVSIVYYIVSLLAMHVLLLIIMAARFSKLGLSKKYIGHSDDLRVGSLLRPAISNIIFNVSAVTINVADRSLVGAIMGSRNAGFYAAPSELALRAVGLVRAATQVILPWAARLSDRDQEKYWSFGTLLSAVVVGSGCVILLLMRESVAVLFLGEKFRSTSDLLGIFSLGILTSTIGYLCIAQLNSRGDFITQRRLYVAAATILVMGATTGAYMNSLTFVALSFLVARGVDLVLLLLLVRHQPIIVRSYFAAIAAILTLALVAGWCHWIWPAVVLLAVVGMIAFSFLRRMRSA